jgi:hypothetical protein
MSIDNFPDCQFEVTIHVTMYQLIFFFLNLKMFMPMFKLHCHQFGPVADEVIGAAAGKRVKTKHHKQRTGCTY